MTHHWKSLDLEITGFEYLLDPTYPGEIMQSQTLNIKHVETLKI